MTFSSNFQWLTALLLDRMVFCLVEGTVFAALVALLLRVGPGRNSRTRFVVWFSALLATASLPFLVFRVPVAISGKIEQDAVTIPSVLVNYLLLAWVLIAFAGVLRVLAALWQLRRTRLECSDLNPESLSTEIARHVESFRAERSLKLLVSSRVSVPAATGFFTPAVIIPQWMLEEASPQELEHVILHELAHLRRRDDWTNLAQKLFKAVLFFHPAVWWMDRKLAIDRELACDDEVLAQTGNPRQYAESLAHIAQKSFLRRQLELAQAALGRFLPLSTRVKRILDSDGKGNRTLWKPAVPIVLAVGVVSGVSLSWTPNLVKVQDEVPTRFSAAELKSPDVARHLLRPASGDRQNQARVWQADLRTGTHGGGQRSVPSASVLHAKAVKDQQEPGLRQTRGATLLQAKHSRQATDKGFVVLIATRHEVTATPTGWEVKVSQVRLLIPASDFQKQVPRRT